MSTSVLFDDLGPRGRRNVRISSIVGGLFVLGLLALALQRLSANGQLEADRWAILFDSRTGVPQSLGKALIATLQVAAVAMVFATILGAILAFARLSDHALIRVPVAVVVEFFRAIPLVILILFLFLGARQVLSLDLSRFWTLVLGLVLYNMAVLCEIIRAGILSIDRGQSEAAYAIGMRKSQVLVFILLPQAIRRMLPALVSQLVVLLKDTSLGFIIAYPELLQKAGDNINFFGSRYSLQLYVAAAAIYIVVNFLLSTAASQLEKRVNRSRRIAAGAAPLAGANEDQTLTAVAIDRG
ncbi:MAG: amino acid ABC transporter permease [Geodermatophilaceae bacterium]|nr:amino acid ABC transporter permease [Geodermatophilaceae bacterium]